ncbi:hypothetical protein IQ13_3600 [Lacibacter cauensis]|uniref:Uncharacterized protein n=1 Tax=Lacibacter cauensis TaxID=510947 RepID=A0A562SD79_9BACT|nr:thioredoxin domain-containing protein [Lacibacter cauensis]TWI79198.1 hypothetical protein IQ13_3600 [Lacibacter cauensis]
MPAKKLTYHTRLFTAAITLLLLSGCSLLGKHKQEGNKLSNASSPYLQEHADNPVDWYEWGEEALAKAKKENKPLLISVGYASCHWCHVMEKESFMDTAVARIMNESFVCIKVDREERPDIDNLYMNACRLLNNGDAGWPLNAFALPDGKPFFAGTYYAKSNWITLLKQVAESYRTKRTKVELQAASVYYGMIDNDQLNLQPAGTKSTVDAAFHTSLFQAAYQQVDVVNGGIKGKQKFPTAPVWDFMLQYYYITGDQKAKDATLHTLTKMALGSIYDQVGGGFARYCTDSVWRVPHFEKMLNDNGQLVSLYAQAYKLTQNSLYKKVLTETLEFIDIELSAPQGGFYSSLNADTEDGEGSFYAWSYNAFNNVVTSEQKKLLADYYNLTEKGNWEKGKNLLYAIDDPAVYAAAKNMDVAAFQQLLQKSRSELKAARNKRTKPVTDTKILTSWNAIMLSGYVDAYTATGNNAYLQRALANASFLQKNMLRANGELMRNYYQGKVSVSAFLEDYAWLSWAYIKLYQVTFQKQWIDLAKKITDHAIVHFYDPASGLFYNTAASSDAVLRKMELQDNAVPSSNAMMGFVLHQLGTLFSDTAYTAKSEKMLLAVSEKIKAAPIYYAQWCRLAGLKAGKTYEVAIMGRRANEHNIALQKKYLPTSVFLGETSNENLPLLANKYQPEKTMIYVCSNASCKRPVEQTDEALLQIK